MQYNACFQADGETSSAMPDLVLYYARATLHTNVASITEHSHTNGMPVHCTYRTSIFAPIHPPVYQPLWQTQFMAEEKQRKKSQQQLLGDDNGGRSGDGRF